LNNPSNRDISAPNEPGKEITKLNQDDEIRRSRRWFSRAMIGSWDGIGIWNLKDKTWHGRGTWEGGHLMGTWDAKGTWESVEDGIGCWKGDGEFVCNMEFMNSIQHYTLILGIILSILAFTLSRFLGGFGLNVTIIIALLIMGLTVLAVWFTRSTSRGKAHLSGTWQDVGESRILDIYGYARLGYHTGTLSGKMIDPLPQ
jgi:hypothetical protein